MSMVADAVFSDEPPIDYENSTPNIESKSSKKSSGGGPVPEIYDRTNDGKAIALGNIFGNLIIATSRVSSLAETLTRQAVFGQASVLALGPESDANIGKSERIYSEVVDVALCTVTGVEDSWASKAFLNACDFKKIDKDRNGLISAAEFRTSSILGGGLTTLQIELITRATDIDGDGQVNFEEFANAYDAFLNDVDGNGFISVAEFQKSESGDSLGLTDQQVNDILRLRKADFDGDGEFTYEEFVKIHDIFRSDVDGNDFVSAAEFRRSIFAENLTDEWVDEMIRFADVDGDGKITIEKFVEACEQVTEFFKADKDGNGFISEAEFRDYLTDLGEDPADLDEIFHEADTDGDGQINWQEFLLGSEGQE